MFNIKRGEREEKEKEWVGDEIDATMDNIPFFSPPLGKESSLDEKKNER
jgi:hypothetical protein